jgi:hypothetical protein
MQILYIMETVLQKHDSQKSQGVVIANTTQKQVKLKKKKKKKKKDMSRPSIWQKCYS